ncbi:MAG: M90 family metallopeptidase [Methylomonas sp.]
MNIIKRARIRYILHRHAVSRGLWLNIEGDLAILQGMTAVEKAHLRELTTLFLHEKNFVSTQGLILTERMRLIIAVQACLPILNLGINCLSGWIDVIVYPGPFRVSRDATDEVGVVHHQEQVLAGEAWLNGPLIVSWADVERDMLDADFRHNVVIHEIAHKLDGLNGRTNGFPPLHRDMSIPEWTALLSEAYQTLCFDVEEQNHSYIDPYAATSPAEFFAVISEVFFCSPETLHTHFPDVYLQLRLYYRQHPLLRRHSNWP